MAEELYSVGDILEEAMGHAEETKFTMDDAGGLLRIYYNGPTEEEIEDFKADGFEVRFTTMKDTIFMLFKIGNLPWMDAPFTPHLSPNLTKYELPQEGMGLGVLVQFADTRTGKLVGMKLIGLSESFTKKFFGNVMELHMKPFSKERYFQEVRDILNKYPTKELMKFAVASCKQR